MEATEVENLVLKLCHLVAALRGEHHISSGLFVYQLGCLQRKHCEHSDVQVRAAERIQSQENACHPQQHSTEWNLTLGETIAWLSLACKRSADITWDMPVGSVSALSYQPWNDKMSGNSTVIFRFFCLQECTHLSTRARSHSGTNVTSMIC